MHSIFGMPFYGMPEVGYRAMKIHWYKWAMKYYRVKSLPMPCQRDFRALIVPILPTSISVDGFVMYYYIEWHKRIFPI